MEDKILNANDQMELSEIIESYFDLPVHETYSESAKRLRDAGNYESAELLELAEKRWFEVEGDS